MKRASNLLRRLNLVAPSLLYVGVQMARIYTSARWTTKFISTISVSKRKYQHYLVTQTHPLQSHSPPMDCSSSPLHSRHKPSSTMLGRSLHLRHAYTEYLRVPPLVSRTHYSGEHGVKMMVGNALLLEVPTGLLPFGMSRVRRSCTSCPVTRVRSLPSTSTLRNQLSSLVEKTVSYLLVNSNRASLSEQCTVPGGYHSGYINALSSLAIIIRRTVDTRLHKKIFANKLGNLGKVETRDDLGHLFHVPHVSTSADWVSALVRTNDLNPVC